MSEYKPHVSNAWDPEPRWPALIAILAVGLIYTALPRYLIVGPRWLFLVILVVLMVPTIVTHFRGHHLLNRAFGFSVIAVLTMALIASVLLLVRALPEHLQSPTELLLSAVSLWLTNIFVFALWYWRLDAGGPHGRDQRPGHSEGAFLFPQMTLPPETPSAANPNQWSPNFVDYLFLAFNTSTAFSPTDVPVLARWAKGLMMVQSLISLTVIVLLAARAVNIL
jgi:uncharacterized protein DUF1345